MENVNFATNPSSIIIFLARAIFILGFYNKNI